MSEVGYGTGGRVGVFYSRSRSMIANLTLSDLPTPPDLIHLLPTPRYLPIPPDLLTAPDLPNPTPHP